MPQIKGFSREVSLDGRGPLGYMKGALEGAITMKIQNWSLKPLKPKGAPVSPDEPLADDIFVSTIVASKDNKQVVLHRVTKVNPDGSEEVFIIKASPKILSTDH
jgi:hypothetical protein